MQNLLLYTIAVLSWGSTWYAIKFQLGTVAPEVSIVYRFALASILLFGWCWIRRLNLNFSLKSHLFLIFQGIFLFSLNYILCYLATNYLASGLNAVVFSSVMIFNILNSAIIYRTPFNAKVTLGAILGILGICTIFWPQLVILDLSSRTIIGLTLTLGGALIASWGNMFSARNQKNKLPVLQTNAYSMGYGALSMLFVVVFQGTPLTFDLSVPYVGTLIYLSVVGSIIAFGCYLTLLGRIGASKASYTIVLSPVMALAISTVFEDFDWTYNALLGVGLILFGNILVLGKKKEAELTTISEESFKKAA